MPLSSLTTKNFRGSYLDEISLSGLFLKSKATNIQKSCATNYVTLNKILGHSVVQPKVTLVEYNFLRQNKIKPLEDTSCKEMYDELMKLLEPASFQNKYKQENNDRIFQIRVKELKYILATVPQTRLNEIKDGYRILDKYLFFLGE